MSYRSLFPPNDQRAVEHGDTFGPVPFESMCPECLTLQPQLGFSRAALGRLLNASFPIEAYCLTCDDFWAISLRERVVLAEGLLPPK